MDRAGGHLCPCMSYVDRAEGQLVAFILWYLNIPQSHHPICSININIYVTFQKAGELHFLLKKDPRQTKCNNLPCCSPLPTTPSPQPCHCISKNMLLSAFPCITYTVNSLEVLYINQLLCSTNRNLACLWGHLIFQIIWIMRTISHSTFTFSAQFFEFMLCISREGSGHPSAQLQLRQGDCPESSAGEALALSGPTEKIVKLCPDFCNANSSSQTWHFWGKREGGFLRPLMYLSWWQVS